MSFETPPDPQPIEMLLPDGYHRAKRAALAFSAILILISVATTKGALTFGAGGASLSLPRDWLFTLVWLAAAYHVGLFLLEYQTATTLNSAWMRTDAAKSFEARLLEVERGAETAIARMNEGTKRITDISEKGVPEFRRPEDDIVNQGMIDKIDGTKHLIIQELNKGGAWVAQSQLQETIERLATEQRQAFISMKTSYVQSIGLYRDQWRSHFKEQHDAMLLASDQVLQGRQEVKQLLGSVTSLASNIAWQRTFIFRHADRTAVIILFLAASIAPFLPHMLADQCLTPFTRLCF